MQTPVPLNSKIYELAKILWEYLLFPQHLEKADAILVLGSYDRAVARYGAELFINAWAPYLIITGGVLHPPEVFNTPEPVIEAEYFAQLAIDAGVPKEKIIIENKALHTGDNFDKTAQLLAGLGYAFDSFILVQKPYMERRSYATGKKRWPEKKLIVTSPPTTFQEYFNSGIPVERTINSMVGDVQRMKVYPRKGYQIEQKIPDEVWEAYEELVRLGFDKRLVAE